MTTRNTPAPAAVTPAVLTANARRRKMQHWLRDDDSRTSTPGSTPGSQPIDPVITGSDDRRTLDAEMIEVRHEIGFYPASLDLFAWKPATTGDDDDAPRHYAEPSDDWTEDERHARRQTDLAQYLERLEEIAERHAHRLSDEQRDDLSRIWSERILPEALSLLDGYGWKQWRRDLFIRLLGEALIDLETTGQPLDLDALKSAAIHADPVTEQRRGEIAGLPAEVASDDAGSHAAPTADWTDPASLADSLAAICAEPLGQFRADARETRLAVLWALAINPDASDSQVAKALQINRRSVIRSRQWWREQFEGNWIAALIDLAPPQRYTLDTRYATCRRPTLRPSETPALNCHRSPAK